MPLLIASLFQGAVFWYAVEKLFMTEIGFTTATIGVMVAIMSAVMIIVETPSGILADRWSRKGVMILGTVALLLSGIIGALSFNEVTFIVSTIFWGIFAALYSGTYDAAVYDTVIEEEGSSKGYPKYLGFLHAVEGLAFIVGALAGGLIAANLGLRETFILSLPLIAMSIYFLLRFKEPSLHRMEVSEPVFAHIRQTFAAVLKNRFLLPVIVAIIGFAVIQETIFEFSQLWFIALATPIVLFGVISATVFSTWTAGGLIAPFFNSRTRIFVACLVLLIALAGLALSQNYWLTLVVQFTIGLLMIAFGVLLSKKMHDQLPSKLRAGSSSVISTIARFILIPLSLVLTFVAQASDIFAASWILLVIGIISVIAFLAVKDSTKLAR